MKKDKVIIYLADLAHNEFGLSLYTIPLGIGAVGAYCQKIHEEDVELSLFRQFDDLERAVKERVPHIVGFGYFSWNDNLSLAASAFVRRMSPHTLIVFGGLNIGFEGCKYEDTTLSQDVPRVMSDFQLLISHPDIDIIVHGDGEVPFADAVARFIAYGDRAKVKSQAIDGCSTWVDGKLLCGKPVPPLGDLDIIPSPYLMGLFTDFFERFKLIPQIETVRGCPYKCTYCTVGGHPSRQGRYSLERVKEEILYLKDHSPNKVLRIADSNWGIIERDVELAEFIRKLHDSYGYPTSLRVYYAANGPFENVKKMAGLLKPMLPLNMSFQSLTKEVLKNIKRKNVSLNKVKDMVMFARANEIATSTELILGLPGETYESSRKGFLKALQLGFDSVFINPLYLIKGSALYTDAARETYEFKTGYSLIGKDVTRINGEYVFEADEVVVESKTMSREDFWELHRFRLFASICYAAAFLKEITMHCLNYGITPLDVYDELVTHGDRYPFFSTMASGYMNCIRDLYFKTPEALRGELASYIERHGNVDFFNVNKHLQCTMGKVLGIQEKQLLAAEYSTAARALYKKKEHESSRDEDFYKILDVLTRLTPEIIITPFERVKKDVLHECSYDLVAWTRDNYERPLSEYSLEKPRLFVFIVRNIDEHYDFIEQTKGWPEVEKYDFYFNTMVSSNMRRYISYADVGRNYDKR